MEPLSPGQTGRPSFLERFWQWYERHYAVNLGITTGLFALQLVHLYWLTTNVVAQRLFGQSYFEVSPAFEYLIIVVDYTEIPALLSTTVLYLYELRRKKSLVALWFLFSINIQWLHLFWITDEFVVGALVGTGGSVLPAWLAWIAIFIDYLELPVIVDTMVRLVRSIAKHEFLAKLREDARYHIWKV